MKKIVLDCAQMTGKKALHDYLAQKLELPFYYGHNLDALYDCLTEIKPCCITFLHISELKAFGDYGQSLLNVFQDAALENKNLQIEPE